MSGSVVKLMNKCLFIVQGVCWRFRRRWKKEL